jgi:putative copper resistance protein D
MEFNAWTVLTLLSRLLIYISTACSIGGIFFWQTLYKFDAGTSWLFKYIIGFCLLGFLAGLFSFLVQVGSLADNSAIGMFDADLISLLARTAIGTASGLQLAGFLTMALSLYFVGKIKMPLVSEIICLLPGPIILLVSYSVTGHLADGNYIDRGIVGLHVLMMSFWIGSLYPLWRLSQKTSSGNLHGIMADFGRLAMYFVAILVICGLWLIYILIDNLDVLLKTPYGLGLLLKLMLVGALLLLAASNKYKWVPKLSDAGSGNQLSVSILLEIVIGLLVLLTTAIMTAVIGLD